MNALELFLLGRRLMRLGEDAIPASLFHALPTGVRIVAMDVMEHPDSSVGEIAARTGFPQSHVSASVARLRAAGVLTAEADPRDRRRTLVRPHPDTPRRAAERASGSIAATVTAAITEHAPTEDVLAALELLAQHLLDAPANEPAEGRPRDQGVDVALTDRQGTSTP